MPEKKYPTIRAGLAEFRQSVKFGFCLLVGAIAGNVCEEATGSPFPMQPGP